MPGNPGKRQPAPDQMKQLHWTGMPAALTSTWSQMQMMDKFQLTEKPVTIFKHSLFGLGLGDAHRRPSTGQFFLAPVSSAWRQPAWDDKLKMAMGASPLHDQSFGRTLIMEVFPANAQAEAAATAGARNSVSPSQPRDRQAIGAWPCYFVAPEVFGPPSLVCEHASIQSLVLRGQLL